MTIEEKLQHFMDITMETANLKCEKAIENYKKGSDQIYEEHKAEAIKKAELQKRIEIDGIKRNAHKVFVTKQLEVKREIALKSEELKTKVFEEVMSKLDAIKKSAGYKAFLIRQIHAAKEISNSEHMNIYIDPTDAYLTDELEAETNVKITISEYSFIGGMRAVIPSKNILIDHSFECKLADAREQFVIVKHLGVSACEQ